MQTIKLGMFLNENDQEGVVKGIAGSSAIGEQKMAGGLEEIWLG